MDPCDVTLVLLLPVNEFSYLELQDEQVHFKSSDDIIISDHVIRVGNYEPTVFSDLRARILNDSKTFYIHDGSEQKVTGDGFIATILSFVIDVLKREYSIFLKSCNFTPEHFKLIKNIKDEIEYNVLYLSIVGKIGNKFVDIFTGDEHLNYISNAFSVVEIRSKENLKFIYDLAMRKISENCTEIIYTFKYKHYTFYACDYIAFTKFYQYCFIESRNLNYYISGDQIQNRDEFVKDVVEGIKDLFEKIQVLPKDISCIVYENENCNPEQSEHVFAFIASNVKRKTSIEVRETLQNKIGSIKKALLFERKRNQYLQSKFEKEIEQIKKSTAQKIIDKLTESHQLTLTNQKQRFDDIIQRINSNHEKNLNSFTKYYENKVNKLDKELSNSIPKHVKEEMLNQIETLQGEVNKYEKENKELKDQITFFYQTINQVQNLLGKINNKNINQDIILSTNVQIPSKNENSSYERAPDVKQENAIAEKNTEQELLTKANKKIDELTAEIKKRDELTEKLTYQYNFITYAKKTDEMTIKQLTEENVELKKDIDKMKYRNSEQFQKYEKLLKKSQEEINLHKREANKLREHLFSENYPPTPPITKSNLRKSISTPDLNIKKTDSLVQKTQSALYLASGITEQLLKLKIHSAETSDFETTQEIGDTPSKKMKGRPRKKRSAKK